jgi:hypothetical protein
MKIIAAILPALLIAQALADAPAAPTTAAPVAPVMHRYLIERTFPAGALAGLDAAGKAKVNSVNAKYGVKWVMSYANKDETKTYCIYNAPSEAAIRDAAKANGIPVDSVAEVPVTLSPK